MNRRLVVLAKVGALLGMLCAIAFSIAMGIKNDQLRRQAKALAKLRDDVCQRLEWDLEALLRRPTDIMPRIVYHHLDQGLTNLCFGKPIVVDTSKADYCWIMRGEPECFLDVARALLDAHHQRRTP